MAGNCWGFMTTATYGSCYGFDITSDVPLSFLRTSTGKGIPMTIRPGPPPEENGKLLQEWNTNRTDVLATRMFKSGSGFLIRIGEQDSYQVSIDPPGMVVHRGVMDDTDQESMIWGTPAAVSLAHRHRLPLHAGSVDVHGRGVVLAATGSFGKTTLAGAFHAAGYRLLADDMSCLAADPEPVLLPGPAVIRARPDVVAGFSFARTTAVRTTLERTHFVLDPGTEGSGDPVPLRAIVFLRMSDGPMVLEPARQSDAIRDLFGLSYRVPTDEGQASAFELAARLMEVPVWDLHRPLTIGSLPEVVQRIVDTCLD